MFYVFAVTTIALGAWFVVVRRKRKAGSPAN
jgi:hypothetical protein